MSQSEYGHWMWFCQCDSAIGEEAHIHDPKEAECDYCLQNVRGECTLV